MSAEAWSVLVTLPPTAALMAFSSWLYNRRVDGVKERQLAFQRQQDAERIIARRMRQQASPAYQNARRAREEQRAQTQAQREQERDARLAAAAQEQTDADALKARLEEENRSEAQYREHAAPRSSDDAFRRQRGRAVVCEWIKYLQLGTTHVEQMARAQGVERQILKLAINEQAVVILLYGLLGGVPLDRAQVAGRLKLREHNVGTLRVGALIKIDLLHIHTAEPDLYFYVWWNRGNCWFKYWTHDSDWALRRRQPAPSRSERAIMTARSESWITFCRTQKFGLPALADDTAAETDAPNTCFVTRSGGVTPWLPEEAGYETIEAVETANDVGLMLRLLTIEERQVIRMTYGVGTSGVFSTREIAAALNITALQTRQIEMTALAKLRRQATTRSGQRPI